MLKPIPIILLCSIFFMLSSCNPKCEERLRIPVSLSVTEVAPGMQILIQSAQAKQLKNLGIYARMTPGDEPSLLQSELVDEQKLVVTMPESASETMELVALDNDCGGYVSLVDLASHEASYFIDNPNFVAPILPQIVIPSISVAPTIDITNAWISPQDRSYCLWFGDFQQTYRANPDGSPIDGDTSTEKIDTIFFDSKFLDEKSIELAIGPCTEDIENSLFHENPVSGVVDFDNNFIQIFIDRTSNPRVGRVEEYIGSFVKPSDIPDESYLIGGGCIPNNSIPPKEKLMVLTSQLTGHQMLLFKND